MLSCLLVWHVLLASVVCGRSQARFSSSTQADQVYEFQWPIKRVAVIGAGISGLLAYEALAKDGHFEAIRVFERDENPGGNWQYTREAAAALHVDSLVGPKWWENDFVPEIPESIPYHSVHEVAGNQTAKGEWELARIRHRAAKPIWDTLRANTPAPQQQIPGYPWPPHVEWASRHSGIQKYLRGFASWLGINVNDGAATISYRTRVERVSKRYDETGTHKGWSLLLYKFEASRPGRYEESWWAEDFDAIIVASGRFNVPWLPSIPGLPDWQQKYSDQILHSRQYRSAENLKGKNVLVLGASASATGISEDINTAVNISYLSIREHSDDPRAPVRRATHLNSLPLNTTIVGEIKRFIPTERGQDMRQGKIELCNGTILTGIDNVIFGTGFRYAFPFLPQYHNSSAIGNFVDGASEQPIVTDGTHVRSLYLDTFYIEQPTIAFQGQNVGIQTFVYGKYVGAAIAKVWSLQASLPSTRQMWQLYWDTVDERGGLKKGFQWLDAEANLQSLRFFTAWLSDAAVRAGGALLDTPPDVSEEMKVWMRARGIVLSGGLPEGSNDFSVRREEADWSAAVRDDW